MLPVKHTVIYTFFAITSVQNTCFCSVFNALASKNPAKSCYVQCFFHFWPFFHCRKATKMTQNSISIPSCAQTPKNPRKMSKTPPNSIADLPEKKCAESFHFPLSTFHVRSFPMAQLRQRLSPNKTFWRGVLVRSGSSTSWRCRVDRAFFWDGRCLMMSAPQWRWENSTEIPSKTGEVPVSLSFWARYRIPYMLMK